MKYCTNCYKKLKQTEYIRYKEVFITWIGPEDGYIGACCN